MKKTLLGQHCLFGRLTVPQNVSLTIPKMVTRWSPEMFYGRPLKYFLHGPYYGLFINHLMFPVWSLDCLLDGFPYGPLTAQLSSSVCNPVEFLHVDYSGLATAIVLARL